jgi:PAS domain S-box-containing protein
MEHPETRTPGLRGKIEDLRTRAAAAAFDRTPADLLSQLPAVIDELAGVYEELAAREDAVQLAMETARLNAARYQELFDRSPEAFIVTDRNGHIQEANQAAAHLLNTSPQFLAGHPLASFVRQEERPAFRTDLSDGNGLPDTQTWDVRMQPRKGAGFSATLSMTPLTDAAGAVLALRWHVRDITERSMIACPWRLRNRTRELRAVVMTTALGLELRVVQPDGVVVSSELLENWTMVQARSDELRRTLEAKAWERVSPIPAIPATYNQTASR